MICVWQAAVARRRSVISRENLSLAGTNIEISLEYTIQVNLCMSSWSCVLGSSLLQLAARS